MQLDTGTWIVIGVSAILIFGYISGYLYNRRLAQQVLVWLDTGLSHWGKVKPGEPLAGMSTGGSLNITGASEPFQRIEAIFYLEPRENLLFWLFDRLRGRQDELILKVGLRSVPDPDMVVEAGKHRDRSFQQAFVKDDKTSSNATTIGGFHFVSTGKNTAPVERVRRFVEQYPSCVTRLSIQRQHPHIFIRARLKNLLNQPSQDFISALGKLCKKEDEF